MASLNSPKLGDFIEVMPAVDLLVTKDMQSMGVGIFKGFGQGIVFLRRIGKISQLHKGIRLFLLHGIEEGIQSDGSIMDQVLMQVGDNTDLDGLYYFRQGVYCLAWEENLGRP